MRAGRGMGDGSSPFDYAIAITSDHLVQYSREMIAKTAIENEFDYLAMIDDDMIGPPDLWDKLLALDVDIVAPLAFTRKRPHYPVVYAQRGGWRKDSPYHPIETHIVRNYPRNQLFECDAVGFGAVLIKVDVLKRMPYPRFFTMFGTDGTGEDIWFCLQAKRLVKARVFCDARVQLLHLGERTYIGEKEYLEQNPEVKTLYEVAGEWSKAKSQEDLIA